jgi:hypothetical protein
VTQTPTTSAAVSPTETATPSQAAAGSSDESS